MILDSIQNIASYAQMSRIKQVLEHMQNLQCSDFPQQSICLIEKDIFINPVEFTTKPEEECLFEAHRKYIDVHFIFSGQEKIIITDIKNLQSTEPFNKNDDIGFFSGGGGTACVLSAGDFLVCYPQDAHKVAIMLDTPQLVKKLVGKIHV